VNNQEAVIAETLQSVRSQTLEDWECIIVNDGSTDQTEQTIQETITGDKRFIYVYQTNAGVSTARNTAIAKATGKYILPLDGDDMLEPDYARAAIDVLEKNPEIGLVYADAYLFGQREGKWDVPPFEWKSFLHTNSIFCSAVCLRSDVDQTTGYDTALKHGLEDWEFWIRLLNHTGKKVHKLSSIGLRYRINESSRNADIRKNEQQMRQSLDYIYTKHAHIYSQEWGNMIEVLRDYDRLQKDNARYLNLLNTRFIQLFLTIRKWFRN
jgi:glycosyltransferase involved in cell wall biosynthesis